MARRNRWSWVCLPLGAVLLALAPWASADDSKPGRKVALLLGVNEYERRGFPALKYAERDVEDLAKVLRDAGFEVRLLTGHKAVKENIDKTLAEVLAKVRKNDMVLIAFSGHGQQIEAEEEGKKKEVPFFCPREAVSGDPMTMVSLSEVLRQLDKKGGKHNLLLVDACRNDPDGARGRGIDGNRAEALPEGTAVMFSCSRGQRAFESMKAGDGHGVFFHFVLEGLRGKAKNNRGAVTWDRLVTYVKESVAENFADLVEGVGGKQTPHEIHNLGAVPELVGPGGKKAERGKVFVNKVGMKLVWIEPGTFLMGSPKDEKERESTKFADETLHKVTLTRGYYIASTLVTQHQWEQVMGNDANRSKFKGKDEDEKKRLPVDNVSWDDCQEFCKKLRELDGRKYTLPTEAEWEYACRAGTTTPFWWGATISTDQANYNGDFTYGDGKQGVHRGKTTPVDFFKPNPWGLYDMHGNLLQWCEDWYAPYTKDDTNDPVNLKRGEDRALHGGFWNTNPGECRAAYRFRMEPDYRSAAVGCRVVCRLD